MNNYMVILGNYDFMFLSVNANKHTVEDILIRYFVLQKFKLIDQSIIDFFNYFEYIAVNSIKAGMSFIEILSSNNYQVIDISNIEVEIKQALYK